MGNFYVYIKNETDSHIVINDKLHIRPHKQQILSSLTVSNNKFLPQVFRLNGEVKEKGKNKKICQYNFTSHTILDSGEKEFQTFLFIKKVGGKYQCQPMAAEVFSQSNSLKPKGLRLRIDAAYMRHKEWKRHVEDSIDPIIVRDPYTGFGRIIKPRISRSN